MWHHVTHSLTKDNRCCHFVCSHCIFVSLRVLGGTIYKHHFESAQFIMWSIPTHCCTLFLNQSPTLEGGIQSSSEVPSPQP